MGKGLIQLLVVLQLSVGPATAQDVRTYLPTGATVYAPRLAAQQKAFWAQMPEPWTLGGLVEQESCISLKHSKCWNPKAELKTHREYGFGFGQITVAYRADGSERFNKFTELRAVHPPLRGWAWADRYDPDRQLAAIVLMCRGIWGRLPPAATVQDHLAMMLSSYNGGVASVLQDRRLCSNTPGCDSGRWFGNVELTSLKSKIPQAAYAGQSWFSINRDHARNIMKLRRDKYETFWGSAL